MNLIPQLHQSLQSFRPVSLEEIRGAALMDRVEFKFLTDVSTLIRLLPQAQKLYRLLSIEGQGLMGYRSTYQDTPDFAFYRAHHLGHPVRSKVRFRRYEQTDSTFLELKQRSRKGQTHKERVQVEAGKAQPGFLQERIGLGLEQLEAKLEVRYRRITLVSEHPAERLTFDLGLNLTRPQTNQTIGYGRLVVAELKTEQRYQGALFPQLVRLFHLRGGGFSKYGVGCCQLYPELPHNRFKPQILAARRIEHGSY
jgi:hypothetical protein